MMTDSITLSPAASSTIVQEHWISRDANTGNQYVEPLTPAPTEGQGTVDPIKAFVDKSDRPKDNSIAHARIIQLLHVDSITRIDARLSRTGASELVFTTYDQHDKLRVHYLADNRLVVDINEHRYHLPDLLSTETLVLRTQGGSDYIDVDHAVSNPVIIDSGAGADVIQTGAGPARVYAGPGNDDIFTRSGDSYVEAGDGDDHIQTHGTKNATIYGGKGNDHIRSYAEHSFIDGGEGNDSIVGSQGHNILSGGAGDDWILANGLAPNTLYTGTGEDVIENVKPDDVVFANVGSRLFSPDGEPVPGRVTPIQATHSSLILVIGSEAFRTRVEDDLQLLRGSGAGQKLLHALSNAPFIGARLFIKELIEGKGSKFTPDEYPTGAGLPDDLHPLIHNGQPGSGVPAGTLYYNPSYMEGEIPGIVQLYHGLCHAYNYLTGTIFPGESLDGIDGNKPRTMIPNAELQAIGLPVDAQPFDFDNDPNTPALNSNPEPLSENGIRRELGLPPRKQYNP